MKLTEQITLEDSRTGDGRAVTHAARNLSGFFNLLEARKWEKQY